MAPAINGFPESAMNLDIVRLTEVELIDLERWPSAANLTLPYVYD